MFLHIAVMECSDMLDQFISPAKGPLVQRSLKAVEDTSAAKDVVFLILAKCTTEDAIRGSARDWQTKWHAGVLLLWQVLRLFVPLP